jgi:hypothetical protein
MTTRKYTSRSQQTTLTSAVTSGAATIPVVSATTLLGGATVSTGQTFTVVIDPDTALEEVVDVTVVSGNNLTITRAIDGSSAQDHSAGSVVRHMIIGRDLREANTHIEASAAVHGIAGSVVGTTDTQTLTNKTITSASETTPTIAGATISGTWTSTATITGGTMNPTTLTQNSVPVLTTTSTSTVTNKTLTSPIINGGTVSSATVTSSTVVSGTLGSDLAAGGYKVSGLATPTATADAATKGYVDTSISNLVASAPAALDTLNELAAALGNDASFSTTVTNNLATKLPKAGGTMTGAIDMGSSKITSLGTPTAGTDATTKTYVDGILGSATAASTSAASAATSASSAATSASSAAASATAAATSATSAAASATAAATSATSSSTYASNSLTSANSAATSATSAAASATAAAASAATASTQATNASTSATAAATSATSAAASATAAATSATSSATSATSSANSASAALTSANSAATSASSAATSASSSLTTYNTYKTYYLGSFSSAPSLDNQGNALITGATYFNSVSSLMYAWSGSAWQAISTTTSYSAPTLGSTTINSGTTYSTITSLTLSGGLATADPTADLGLATKQYVDAVTASINFHAPVRLATTSNLSVTYSNGSSGVGATLTATGNGRGSIDGVNISTNDRILVKDQTTQFQNGVYTVTNQGGPGTPFVLTRATDYDTTAEVTNGDVVFTTAGTVNTGVTFVNTSTNPVTIGSTAITFSVYTSASLPSQTGNSGRLLTTDGTTPSWTNSVTNLGLTTPTIAGATISGTVTSTATVTGGTYSSATLTGTLTAGGSAGTNGYYLQTTGSGVQWAAVAGYTAPTLGSTTLTSGSTITTVAGLTLTTPVLTTPTITLSTTSSTTDARMSWDTTNKKIQVGNGTAATDFASSTLVTNAQTASYTTVLTDKDKMIEMNVASANNLTVPLNSSVAYPVGTQINILQTGAGQTTVVATGGVTINSTPGLKLRAQWSSATLIKRATDTWVLVGDLSA